MPPQRPAVTSSKSASLRSLARERVLGESVFIRTVRGEDFPQWKLLWDGYNAFYGRKGATALPEATTAMTWARFFDSYEPVHALVAEHSDQLLGLVHFLFHRSTISIAPVCYLQDLFTVESSRGKGVGRALIQEVYRRAAEAGCSRVYWLTHESNATAMKLYDKIAEKTGFIVYRKNF
jgi:GNAT superfamily N-acetyltransferase